VHSFLVTADVVVFGLIDDRLNVLLVQRAAEPFEGMWALPGAELLPELDPSLEHAAHRRLEEKTGLANVYLEQVITVSGPDRDPRGYSISTVFMALVRPNDCRLQAGDRVSAVAWYPVDGDKPDVPLAFDHEELLGVASRRLRAKAEYSLLPALLLPELFTVPELERLYHRLIAAPCPNYTLRRRLATGPWLRKSGQTKLVGKKQTQLYRLDLAQLGTFLDAAQ
jgi:8-oxo-dGTP diphosphatase